jgi:[acyl-carrier-protein] S-malonyltransferase
MPSDKLALLFPGQGAHCNAMLDAHAGTRYFDELYQVVCDVLGYSLLESVAKDPALINANLVSSMLTVLASCLAWKRFGEETTSAPDYLAGYSVGQLTALHVAGCFDFAELARLVMVRAKLMDECFIAAPGAMLAVIGLPQQPVDDICCRLTSEGHSIWISNFNCLGQYSLSGTRDAIAAAQLLLAEEKPRKLLELPVSGAWHSPLLQSCQAPFAAQLRDREWNTQQIPVVDNVTGEFLPNDPALVKEQLVKHLTHPVQWQAGLKMLVNHNCTRFIEIGYGNTLTKFGFFIDRTATFESFYGDAKTACVG